MKGFPGLCVAAAALAGTCLFACSLTTSLDGFAVDVTSLDAASGDPAADAAAAHDAIAQADVGAPADADARADADAPPPSFCDGHSSSTTVCADFDDGTLPATWGKVVTSGGATAAMVGGGLSLILGPSANGGACLMGSLPRPTNKVAIELDIRIERPGTSDFDMLLIGRDNTTSIGLEIAGTGAVSVDEDRTAGERKTPVGKSIGATWSHVAMTITVAGTIANVAVSVDGSDPFTVAAETSSLTRPTLDLELGECVAGSATSWSVAFDNVTIKID